MILKKIELLKRKTKTTFTSIQTHVACFDKMIEKVTVPEDSALRISTNGSNWHFVMFIAPTLTKKYTKDCFFISKRYNSEENLKEIVEIIKAFYNAENYWFIHEIF